jgi:hypothetical protein
MFCGKMTLLKGNVCAGHTFTYGLPLYTIDEFLSMGFFMFSEGFPSDFLFSQSQDNHQAFQGTVTAVFSIFTIAG